MVLTSSKNKTSLLNEFRIWDQLELDMNLERDPSLRKASGKSLFTPVYSACSMSVQQILFFFHIYTIRATTMLAWKCWPLRTTQTASGKRKVTAVSNTHQVKHLMNEGF